MTLLPHKFINVPYPKDNSKQIDGHLCNKCQNQTWVGDGGQDEASGRWEYYWQGCNLQRDQFNMPFCIDPFWEGPDESGNTVIVTECKLFSEVRK